MTVPINTLRILHIIAGLFWAGGAMSLLTMSTARYWSF